MGTSAGTGVRSFAEGGSTDGGSSSSPYATYTPRLPTGRSGPSILGPLTSVGKIFARTGNPALSTFAKGLTLPVKHFGDNAFIGYTERPTYTPTYDDSYDQNSNYYSSSLKEAPFQFNPAFSMNLTPQQAIQEAMRQAQRDAATVQNMRFVDESAGLGATPQYQNFYNYLPGATRTTPSTTASSYSIPYRTQSQIDAAAQARQVEELGSYMNSDTYKYYEDSLMSQNPEYWENQGIRPDSHAVMMHEMAMNQG